MKVAARITRVLAGDSPVALLHATTAQGHDIKIEVATESLDSRAVPGDILLVEWVIFQNFDTPTTEP